MFFKNFWIFIVFLFLTGCVYPYAMKVKFVSLDGSLKEGTSVGPIKGEDCTLYVGGYALGNDPSLDQALINASLRVTNPLAKMGMMSASSDQEPLRYIVNMHSERTGFNIWLLARKCIQVTGVGYK